MTRKKRHQAQVAAKQAKKDAVTGVLDGKRSANPITLEFSLDIDAAEEGVPDKFASAFGAFASMLGFSATTFESAEMGGSASERFSAATLQPGDHFAWVAGGLCIYGTVEVVRESYVWGPCFSILCPGGEVGATSTSDICSKLTVEQFAYCKRTGWPNDPFAIFCIANGGAP